MKYVAGGLIVVAIILMLVIAEATGFLAAQEATTRGGDWVQTTAADFEAGTGQGIQVTRDGDGELRLAAGETTGVFTSTVGVAAFPFNAVVAHWSADVPPGTQLTVAVRVSSDGMAWSPWYNIVEVEQGRDGRFYGGNIIMTEGGRYLQYRLMFLKTSEVLQDDFAQQLVYQSSYFAIEKSYSRPRRSNHSTVSPKLSEITLTYIDSTAGPNLAQAKASARREVSALGVHSRRSSLAPAGGPTKAG